MVDYRGPQFLKNICQRFNIDWFDRIIWIEFKEYHEQQLANLDEMSHLERVSWSYSQWKQSTDTQLVQERFADNLFLFGSSRLFGSQQKVFYPSSVLLQFRGDVLEASTKNPITNYNSELIPYSEYKPEPAKATQLTILK